MLKEIKEMVETMKQSGRESYMFCGENRFIYIEWDDTEESYMVISSNDYDIDYIDGDAI